MVDACKPWRGYYSRHRHFWRFPLSLCGNPAATYRVDSWTQDLGAVGISGQTDARSPYRRELTSLAQTLQATEQVVADYSLWVRKQREHLEALSWELDCVKDLAWTKRAVGAQDAGAQASSAALLSQEAILRAQAVATLGQPDSILGQAREAQQWTEQLLWGTGQLTRTPLWGLKLKGLVSKFQMLHLQLLGLSVRAGVVGGDVYHSWGVAKARTLLQGYPECRATGALGRTLLTGFLISLAGMQGSGTWAGCVPALCGVPTCPGALPKAQWALVASWNSSHSLDIVVPALEQHQQLVQSHRGHGWKPWGKSQRTMAWPQGGRRHIPLVTHPYQLQQIQATVTPSETQAQKTWHHARGP
nr:uncharacterized protein LOC104845911 [Loxodonta africana]